MANYVIGTALIHGSGQYVTDNDDISMDYQYSYFTDPNTVYGFEVRAHFGFGDSTTVVENAIKDAIIADLQTRLEVTLVRGNIRII
jgi:hypothetical protein